MYEGAQYALIHNSENISSTVGGVEDALHTAPLASSSIVLPHWAPNSLLVWVCSMPKGEGGAYTAQQPLEQTFVGKFDYLLGGNCHTRSISHGVFPHFFPNLRQYRELYCYNGHDSGKSG